MIFYEIIYTLLEKMFGIFNLKNFWLKKLIEGYLFMGDIVYQRTHEHVVKTVHNDIDDSIEEGMKDLNSIRLIDFNGMSTCIELSYL